MKKIKKLAVFFLVTGFAFVMWACNDPPPVISGGEGEDIEIKLDGTYGFGENKGAEVSLGENGLLCISNYSSVTVVAELFEDDECTAKITGDTNGFAHFNLLKKSGGWEDETNKIFDPHIWNMKNGENTRYITTETGIPAVLLLAASSGAAKEVKGIKVEKITFHTKSDSDGEDVIFDWGSGAKTSLFPTDGEWPGRSLPLAGASTKSGDLLCITSYKEVIVDAVVYDRNDKPFTETGKTPYGNAFFTLTTAEGNWPTTEIVKKYDMAVEGVTSVTPETNERKVDDERAWGPGIPTFIVLQGRYGASQPLDTLVGYVILRKITFVAK